MNIQLFNVADGFIKNQCYLAYSGNAGVLIDPAWDYTLINRFLQEHAITLNGILLTHAHKDHTHLAQAFALHHAAPVFMSAAEIDYYAFHCPHLQSVSHLQPITALPFNIIPILTPGHTPGSTCYLIGDHVFTGDTVFIEGVGACNFEGGDADKMYGSVQLLKSYLPGYTKCWPGHSYGTAPGQTLDYLLKNNIYFQFEKREAFVAFRNRKHQPNPFNFK